MSDWRTSAACTEQGNHQRAGLLGPRLVIVENPLCLPAGVYLPRDLTGGLLLPAHDRRKPTEGSYSKNHVGSCRDVSCLRTGVCSLAVLLGAQMLPAQPQLKQSQGHSGGATSDRCSQAAVPICWEL